MYSFGWLIYRMRGRERDIHSLVETKREKIQRERESKGMSQAESGEKLRGDRGKEKGGSQGRREGRREKEKEGGE